MCPVSLRKPQGVDISKLIPVFRKRSVSLSRLPTVSLSRPSPWIGDAVRMCGPEAGTQGTSVVVALERPMSAAPGRSSCGPPRLSLLCPCPAHGCVRLSADTAREQRHRRSCTYMQRQTGACGHMHVQADVRILSVVFHRCEPLSQTSGLVCEKSGRGRSCVPVPLT